MANISEKKQHLLLCYYKSVINANASLAKILECIINGDDKRSKAVNKPTPKYSLINTCYNIQTKHTFWEPNANRRFVHLTGYALGPTQSAAQGNNWIYV